MSACFKVLKIDRKLREQLNKWNAMLIPFTLSGFIENEHWKLELQKSIRRDRLPRLNKGESWDKDLKGKIHTIRHEVTKLPYLRSSCFTLFCWRRAKNIRMKNKITVAIHPSRQHTLKVGEVGRGKLKLDRNMNELGAYMNWSVARVFLLLLENRIARTEEMKVFLPLDNLLLENFYTVSYTEWL